MLLTPHKVEGYTALVDPKENTASNNSSVVSAASTILTSSRRAKNYFPRLICYPLIVLK
jgi:hypothetical protein